MSAAVPQFPCRHPCGKGCAGGRGNSSEPTVHTYIETASRLQLFQEITGEAVMVTVLIEDVSSPQEQESKSWRHWLRPQPF